MSRWNLKLHAHNLSILRVASQLKIEFLMEIVEINMIFCGQINRDKTRQIWKEIRVSSKSKIFNSSKRSLKSAVVFWRFSGCKIVIEPSYDESIESSIKRDLNGDQFYVRKERICFVQCKKKILIFHLE